MSRLPNKFIDLLLVTRPVVLIPVWGFSALGLRAAVAEKFTTGFFNCWNYSTLLSYVMIVVFSLSVAAVYILNQLADIEADRNNGGLPLIASGIVSVRLSVAMMIACFILSVILPFIFHQPLIAVGSVVSMFIGTVYSIKPFRFSGRPVVDFVSNAAGYGIIAFSVGWISSGKSPFTYDFCTSSLPYFFLMAAGSVSSTLPDIEGDRKDNKMTTAVVLGKKNAHILALVLLITSLACGIVIHDIIAILCASISLPLYMYYLFSLNNDFVMESTYKIGGGACMVAAFIAMPWFFLMSFIVFIGTLLYFRFRHGVNYPSLSPCK